MARPNIVIFNPDQWRWDVMGHLGNPAAITPNLDRMARDEGVSFSNAYCQNPVCTPSRCSFMTGWYPHVRGHRTMFHMLRQDEPCMLQILKDQGYNVWWGGKNDLVPGQHGYDRYCTTRYRSPADVKHEPGWHGLAMKRYGDGDGSPDYYSMYVGKLEPSVPASREKGLYFDHEWADTLGAMDFIRNAPRDKPFCLFLALSYPHPPYGVEEPYYSMIDRSKLPPRAQTPDWSKKPSLLKGIHQRQGLQHWTEAQWTELRATYYGMCARVDAQFGLILQALRESGIYDDTAVMCFPDHGDFTGDYGLVEKTQNTFEDCLTRVPLIIKPPKSIPVTPRVTDAMVELVDIPATVYELSGIKPAYWHFGKSLLPLMAGHNEHRDAVFCEGGRLDNEEQAMELDSEQSNKSLYWPRVSLQKQVPEHTKATMVRTKRYKYVRRLYERDELYDMQSDPMELANRIDDPSLAAVLQSLKDRMLQWYQETCDVVPLDADRRS